VVQFAHHLQPVLRGRRFKAQPSEHGHGNFHVHHVVLGHQDLDRLPLLDQFAVVALIIQLWQSVVPLYRLQP
jgi:hypothetical protein